MKDFEVYENNGGCLTMVILEESAPVAMFYGWETGAKGSLIDAINQLEENEEAYKSWDGDALEIANENYLTAYGEADHYTLETLYEETGMYGEQLIADGEVNGDKHLYIREMGDAALDAFGLPCYREWEYCM